MTYQARFAEDSLTDAAAGYEEVAKGVFQLWRFFSHVRRGVFQVDGTALDAAAVPVLLTLDNWLIMSGELQKAVLAQAAALAAARDPEIRESDRRPVVFCSVEDLEFALLHTTDEGFLDALRAATEERFIGWRLPDVRRDLSKTGSKLYPFIDRMAEVLPWWRA